MTSSSASARDNGIEFSARHTASVYLAPFHSRFKGYEVEDCRSTYKALSEALDRNEWPYDTGDDPSFFSARYFGGQLTWGICRQQVRNAIEPADVVVFFSFRHAEEHWPVEYSLCAVATVERKIRVSDIWSDPAWRAYQRYLNLVIRPEPGTGWEHFERGLPQKKWHGDWAWRIAEHDGLTKSDFDRLNASSFFPVRARVRGHSVGIAPNYVLFSSDPPQTHILTKPPVVAWCKRPGTTERWEGDTLSQRIKELTVGYSRQHGGRGTLRTINLQRSHPVATWSASAAEVAQWRERLMAVCRDCETISGSSGAIGSGAV
jgi:hypothetical protein